MAPPAIGTPHRAYIPPSTTSETTPFGLTSGARTHLFSLVSGIVSDCIDSCRAWWCLLYDLLLKPLKSPSHRWGEYQYHWTIRIRIRFLYDSDSIFCTQISDPVAPVDPTWQDLAIAAASDTPLGDRRPRQRRRARSPLGTSAGSPIRTARVRGEAEQLDKTQTVILPYPVGALFRYLSRLPLAPQAARSAVV